MPELVEKDPAVSLPGGQVDASHPPPDRDADNDIIINSVAQEPEIQYPSGIILVLIVGGLLMSMFLVALDMVSSHLFSLSHSFDRTYCTDGLLNRSHDRALFLRLYHASLLNSAAWRTLAGTAALSS